MLTFPKLEAPERGRLGNQLFELAALVCLARQYGHTPVIADWLYKEFFQLNGLVFQQNLGEPVAVFEQRDLEQIERCHNHAFFPENWHGLSQYSDNYLLAIDGFFQNANFFSAYGEYIRNDLFAFKKSYSKEVLKKMPALSNFCGVHVRRGDYRHFLLWLPVLTKLYYKTAIQQVVEETGCNQFMVFSDDIPWCRKHLTPERLKIDVGISYASGEKEIDDFLGLSHCRYHILSNSTFAWWTAYLGESSYTIMPPVWGYNPGRYEFADAEKALFLYDWMHPVERNRLLIKLAAYFNLDKRFGFIFRHQCKQLLMKCFPNAVEPVRQFLKRYFPNLLERSK